ncbi:choice-of-anchor U domain-containing protein, partial [Desulfosarcina sp.]|uniref:choice-of-anchor U domain-containing protein n=1 Tax=Desulfosarcina sp. TaxID=2027861 RepID=UPI003562B291
GLDPGTTYYFQAVSTDNSGNSSNSIGASFTTLGTPMTDTDGDGVADANDQCPGYDDATDLDADGVPDGCDDSDGDGLSDAVEGSEDTDRDGTPDYMDMDADGDGVNDEIEHAAPNNGDGNSDGIPDRSQNRVASLMDHDAKDYITFESPEGTALTGVQAAVNPSPGDMPEGSTLSSGLFDFTIHGVGAGGSVQMTLYLPPGTKPDSYLKYGRTPDNIEDHWYEFVYDGVTGAQINENKITLYFVDANEGDDILTQDGMIIDIGGPMVDNMVTTPSGDGGCFIGCMLTGVD